jgi:hypothetical protein
VLGLDAATRGDEQDQTWQHPSDGSKQPGYRQEEEGTASHA